MDQKHETEHTLTRRELISGAVMLVANATMAVPGYGEIASSRGELRRNGESTTSDAVVLTTAGELQGFIREGVFIFKGVPYAAAPTGLARYMPPVKPIPWNGKRAALSYGPNCPQASFGGGGERKNDSEKDKAGVTKTDQSDSFSGHTDEDCLFLNVWTSGLDNRKRPVMFWLHGGGFDMGSGKQNGEFLARRGDVVVVTVNHRLGVLGFLDLTAYGPEFAKSANVGMLDIVAALEWVRDNISNFGGDPGNVTIFGQSGGGGKVTALMAMPAGKGLFHKAIVMSGSMMFANMPDESAAVGSAVLTELGLTKRDVGRIHGVSIDQLVAAGAATKKKLQPPRPFTMGRQMWGPTLDREVLPWAPFDPASPKISSSIPMMVGSTLTEFALTFFNPQAYSMTDADLYRQLFGTFGIKSQRIIDVSQKLYPEAKPVEIASIVTAITMFRAKAILQATLHSQEGTTPVYLYQFCWRSHGENGHLGATHASDIPFTFYDMDDKTFSGDAHAAIAMAAQISDAWISFARTGDPNHSGLARWPRFDAKQEPVMIFDDQCQVKPGFDRELRDLLAYEIGIDGR